MHGKLSAVLALCVLAFLAGNAAAQPEVSWGGGDGRWDDANWTDGGGLATIDTFVGQMDGTNGAGGPNGGETIRIASGTVEYPANDLQSDFRIKQGSDLVITGGATWIQRQDDTWSENRWTEMDLSNLILDNGSFIRTGAVRDEGGGALIFGSWRGDDNQDTWLPNQETSILITNGGRLENEGSLWFGAWGDGPALPDSVFTLTINDGTVDLTGGDIPPDGPAEGDLMFIDAMGNNPTFTVNFTGPGSITVDSTGIVVATFDEIFDNVSYQELWDRGILQANGRSGPDGEVFANFFNVTGSPGADDYTLSWRVGQEPVLQAGDADENLKFDQFDIIKVQQAAKYLTGQAATWGEGDWDGAPGGSQGNPPPGDGFFNQLDVIAALNPAHYLTGPYAAIQAGGTEGDEQTSIVYNPATGELAVDAPANTELTSINIDSAAAIFTGDAAQNLGGSFDNDADNNIFKATFGSSFGTLSFGNVAQPGLSQDFVLNDLTVIGSLAGGGDLGNVDLIYVPEPSAVILLGMGIVLLGWRTWRCART